MLDLFRFMMLRPPLPIDQKDLISIDNDGHFQSELRQVQVNSPSTIDRKRIAKEFIESSEFVTNPATMTYGSAFEDFSIRLQQTESLQAVKDAIKKCFQDRVEKIVNKPEFQIAKRRLVDSLIAVKIDGFSNGAPINIIERNIRLISLMERAAADDKQLDEEGRIFAVLNQPIIMPDGVFPFFNPKQVSMVKEHNETYNRRVELNNEVAHTYEQLEELYTFLTTLQPDDLEYVVSNFAMGDMSDQIQIENNQISDFKPNNQLLVEEQIDNQRIASSISILVGPGNSILTLKDSTLKKLSSEVHSILDRLKIDLSKTSIPVAIEQVKKELQRLTPFMAEHPQNVSNITIAGNTLYGDIPILPGEFGDLPQPERDDIPLPVPIQPVPDFPITHGNVKPIGIGDLLVVKQQLIGYEAGDVAYIENILKGETHSRSFSRREAMEVTAVTERESIVEEERDLQTTERFELKSESEKVASMDGHLRSPAYGSLLEFSNSSSTPLHGSLKNSEQIASTYGKEVTSRALSNITERFRTKVTHRTLREFQEKTNHSYDNKEGKEHVIGIYEWVEKVNQAQVYNYGKRLLYDIIVPEPGIFLLKAFEYERTEERELVKPEPFTIGPQDITELNYVYYANKYGAVGIEPPPPLYTFISKTLKGTPSNMNEGETQALELSVPQGYQAYCGFLRHPGFITLRNHEYDFGIVVSENIYHITNNNPNAFWDFPLYGNTGSIPIAVKAWNIVNYTCAIGITCIRTVDSYLKWQKRTYDIISQSHQRKRVEYEERLVNILTAVRSGVIGQSAEEKEKLIRNELKKNCISTLTYQYFDAFNGISLVPVFNAKSEKPDYYPQILLPKAEEQGKYIRFFEQAFEWEQLTYTLYSYFWGRKEHWINNILLEDPYLEFSEFLKSGSARVVFPVRPGFEHAVIHFMETGEIWEGGDLPKINDVMYVPLLKEIQERNKMSGTESPYGEPWKIKQPTTLVKLRKDGTLPKWKKQNGEWVSM